MPVPRMWSGRSASGAAGSVGSMPQVVEKPRIKGLHPCGGFLGGGISGALAALGARAEGADVVLVEKQAMIGGSASLSSGFMVTVDNDNFGDDIDDSWEKMASVLHGVHD